MEIKHKILSAKKELDVAEGCDKIAVEFEVNVGGSKSVLIHAFPLDTSKADIEKAVAKVAQVMGDDAKRAEESRPLREANAKADRTIASLNSPPKKGADAK